MTPNEAHEYMENEIRCVQRSKFCDRVCNKCELVKEDKPLIEAYGVAVLAIEKQIPKKPYKRKEHKQNDYYCTICKCYLGDDMELKHACLQPEYCQHCGQALDWSDTE